MITRPRIGVAITTRNRRGVFERSLSQWQRWAPPDSILVVVDDASDVPLGRDGWTVQGQLVVGLITNEHRLGVAMSKNLGIEALMAAGCEHLFLADDDVAPTRAEWWRPYIESPEPHLSYQWPNVKYRESRHGYDDGCHDGRHFQVEFPRGVLLYAERRVIDTVGGLDPAFGVWGGEHVEWQARIHAAGLTTWRYADVLGSQRLWYEPTTRSTFPANRRKQVFECNDRQWQKPQPRFVPYRTGHGVQDYSKLPVLQGENWNWPLLQHVLTLEPSGTAIEFGVGTGATTAMIAAQMPVIGFDSFKGLPEDWRPEFPKGVFAGGVPIIENATIVEGWFADTLPQFDFAALDYIGLVHFDADLYSSTKTALQHVGPHLRPGTYCVFDEMWDYPGHEEHELKAWREFAEETGIGWTVVGYGPCEPWAIRIG